MKAYSAVLCASHKELSCYSLNRNGKADLQLRQVRYEQTWAVRHRHSRCGQRHATEVAPPQGPARDRGKAPAGARGGGRQQSSSSTKHLRRSEERRGGKECRSRGSAYA